MILAEALFPGAARTHLFPAARGPQAIVDALTKLRPGLHPSVRDALASALQRDPSFRAETPRILRPDLLLTDNGIAVTELDSVPGGVGLTAWLYQAYASALSDSAQQTNATDAVPAPIPFLGSSQAMLDGFAGIFGAASQVHLLVSQESGTYRPEMQWLCQQWPEGKFQVRESDFTGFQVVMASGMTTATGVLPKRAS